MKHANEFYVDNNGVIRWNSSDNVPPTDILTEFLVAGLVTQEEVLRSISKKEEEDLAFIEQYVANRKKYGYSQEELVEMRNAFGDEEVVDIFTGQKIAFN